MTAAPSRQHEYTSTSGEWDVVHAVTARVDRRHFWHVTRNETIYQTLKAIAPPLESKSFLEVGSGVGNVIGFLHEKGWQDVTGWELNPRALSIARARYPRLRFESVDFRQADDTRQFDVIGLFDCLEHIADDLACLFQLTRFLKPKGCLILTVPAHQYLWSWHDEVFGHYRRYERADLTRLLSAAGYADAQARYFMAPLEPLMLFSRKLGGVKTPQSTDEVESLYRRESDLPHPLLNAALKAVLRLERSIMPFSDIGLGTSLIAYARRPKA